MANKQANKNAAAAATSGTSTGRRKSNAASSAQKQTSSSLEDTTMAIAPYVAPFGSGDSGDFGLPFNVDQDAATSPDFNAWNFANGGIGSPDGSPSMFSPGAFTSANPQTASAGKTAQQTDSPLLSTSRPSASQLPTHIAKNNPFLNKLRSMVDDPNTDELIRWSEDGNTFLVPNQEQFGNEVLPRFFKHNRFSSFVRQLNMYGFHKVPHLQQGALKTDPEQHTELWEFRNENFKRDRPELLLNMQRKRGVRVQDESEEKARAKSTDEQQSSIDAINGALTRAQRGDTTNNEFGLLQLASVWQSIKMIQSAQQGINDNLRHLHNTNAELWREAAEQRARSKKQEETINKMLRFLAGVFGSQDGGNNNIHAESRSPDPNRSPSNSSRQHSTGAKGGRRRLLIGDGSQRAGQIEEIEVPEEDEPVDEPRIIETNSGSNSPQTANSPVMSRSKLPSVGESPATSQAPPPPVTTPGGSRKLSSQASQQLFNALTSGGAQQWLANLFGQQSSASGSSQAQTPRATGDNSSENVKLDQQTLAALQNIFSAGGAGSNGGYFDGTNTGPSQWNNASALSPRSTVDQSQISKLPPQQQNLQNVTNDANAVQNALNSLIEGMKIEGNGMQNPAAAAAAAPLTPPSGQNAGGEAPPVDVDSLLSEFFHENPSMAGDAAATTPTFAFTPTAMPDGDSLFADATVKTATPSQAGSAATSASGGSPPETTSRKRKKLGS